MRFLNVQWVTTSSPGKAEICEAEDNRARGARPGKGGEGALAWHPERNAVIFAPSVKPQTAPLPAPSADSMRLSRAQLMVMLAALLGWFFDGYEIGLFPLVARPALQSILGTSGGGDALIGQWMGTITACFLVGAALGGTVFGWLGDRIGRVRAMALSILVYSLVTGAGYFATTPWHLGIVRFTSALGMGGQWSLGVALMMEWWPEKWRPWLAGLMGVSANAGMLLLGLTGRLHPVTSDSWRWVMWVAALPALLVFFIILAVPESPRWLAVSKEDAKNPLAEIFSRELIRTTLLGLAFASVVLIGTWGCVQWLPTWADQMAGAATPPPRPTPRC